MEKMELACLALEGGEAADKANRRVEDPGSLGWSALEGSADASALGSALEHYRRDQGTPEERERGERLLATLGKRLPIETLLSLRQGLFSRIETPEDICLAFGFLGRVLSPSERAAMRNRLEEATQSDALLETYLRLEMLFSREEAIEDGGERVGLPDFLVGIACSHTARYRGVEFLDTKLAKALDCVAKRGQMSRSDVVRLLRETWVPCELLGDLLVSSLRRDGALVGDLLAMPPGDLGRDSVDIVFWAISASMAPVDCQAILGSPLAAAYREYDRHIVAYMCTGEAREVEWLVGRCRERGSPSPDVVLSTMVFRSPNAASEVCRAFAWEQITVTPTAAVRAIASVGGKDDLESLARLMMAADEDVACEAAGAVIEISRRDRR